MATCAGVSADNQKEKMQRKQAKDKKQAAAAKKKEAKWKKEEKLKSQLLPELEEKMQDFEEGECWCLLLVSF